MRVRELTLPDGQVSFTVLSADGPVEAIERYLAAAVDAGLAPNAALAYAYDLAAHFRWLEHRHLTYEQVTLEHLGQYMKHLRTTTERSFRKQLEAAASGVAPVTALRAPDPRTPQPPGKQPGRSVSTAQRHLTTLFGFYEWWGFEVDLPLGRQLHVFAQQRGGRKRVGGEWLNTKSRPLGFTLPERRPKTLTAEQVTTLFDACDHRRDRLLLALMWTPGLRVGQVLALRHSDFNGRKRQVSVIPRDDAPLDHRTKRAADSEPLVLPVEDSVLRLHAAYLQLEYGELDSDYVFVNLWGQPHGARMTYQGVRSVIATLIRRTGIDFTPHTLRHSFATDLLNSGARKELVSALLGHASVATTDIYDNRTVEDMRAELAALRRDVPC